MKSSANGTIYLQNAAVAVGDGAKYPLSNCDHLSLTVQGTFAATIIFEMTMDDVTWFEVAMHDLNSNAANDKAKTIVAPGIFALEYVGGFLFFRARISSYTSGSVTVIANAHG